MTPEKKTPPNPFAAPKKRFGWVAPFFRKSAVGINIILAVVVLLAMLPMFRHQDDPDLVPTEKISLMEGVPSFDEPAVADTASPDVLSPLPEPVEAAAANASPKILLSPNPFENLTRRRLDHASLHIIDPLPQLTATAYDNQTPAMGKGGETPWQSYARPSTPPPGAAKIAAVFINLGLDKELTVRAIAALPPDVSLSFSPYAEDLKNQIAMARTAGHETFIDLTLETKGGGDGGPYGIVGSLSEAENTVRLLRAIGQGAAISGVVAAPPKPTTLPTLLLLKMVAYIQSRGLIYVGAKMAESASPLTLGYDFALLDDLNRTALALKFKEIEAKAETSDKVLVVIDAKPSSISSAITFFDNLEGDKKAVLVPVTALVEQK